MQGLIRDCFENLHSNKLENLDKMENFLDTYNHAKLNQEGINHLNRSITYNEIEAEIRSIPGKKCPGPGGFSTEFYQLKVEPSSDFFFMK
jgi:hypothetical protein